MELKKQVEQVVESIIEHGEKPEDVIVSMQIDSDPEKNLQVEGGSVWTNEEISVNYDGNGLVSGCVINGWKPSDS
jgi:hypothetical protein